MAKRKKCLSKHNYVDIYDKKKDKWEWKCTRCGELLYKKEPWCMNIITLIAGLVAFVIGPISFVCAAFWLVDHIMNFIY